MSNDKHLYICDGECYLNDKGQLVRIENDFDCECPRDWECNMGTFYTWTRSYMSPDGDKHIAPAFDELVESFGFNPDKVTNPAQLANNLNAHGYCALPVSKYEHSGVIYRVGSPDQFYDRWDSCYCGIIFASCAKVRELRCVGRVTQKVRNEVYEEFASEVKLYSDWADGNCHGYIITDQNGDEVDSCWGFIGDDAYANGIVDYTGELHECQFSDVDEYLDFINEVHEKAAAILDGMTAAYEDYAA